MVTDDCTMVDSYPIYDNPYKVEGDYENEPLGNDEEDICPLYVERLHPRMDFQRKPFWLRIRSNPFRANYH